MPYPTRLTTSGATAVITAGRLGYPGADGLRHQLCSLVENGAVRVVVDLSRVETIDSSGIGALIAGLKAARRAGGDLRLAAPPPPAVRALQVMELDRLLIAHDSAESAFPA